MVIFPVTYRQLLDDPNADKLLSEYAEECSLPELGEVNPQRDLYAAMEASGGLQCFGVYATRLVGFTSLLTWTVPHYGKTIVSTESIFLSRSFRGSNAGIRMLDFVVDYAREKKVRMLQITVPVGSRLGKLLSLKSEYRHSNNVFVRGL